MHVYIFCHHSRHLLSAVVVAACVVRCIYSSCVAPGNAGCFSLLLLLDPFCSSANVGVGATIAAYKNSPCQWIWWKRELFGAAVDTVNYIIQKHCCAIPGIYGIMHYVDIHKTVCIINAASTSHFVHTNNKIGLTNTCMSLYVRIYVLFIHTMCKAPPKSDVNQG